MKIAYAWLTEYVNTTTPPLELGERLQMTSSALEEVIDWGAPLKGLVTGIVKNVIQHPNADRLRIATVEVGDTLREIVCGAPNLAEGQHVVVALPGTVITPSKGQPITIQESTIRGHLSQGMLCAADEFGVELAGETGILVLPSSVGSGIPLTQFFEFADSSLDLEITANRPDLYSYIGLAREIAAFEKRSLLEPAIATLEVDSSHLAFPLTIEVSNSQLCQRYSALCLDGITVGPSPLWLQLRLLHSGIRPINTVVDIGNYVMLEFGQPLHTFDLDRLLGISSSLEVRSAQPNESLELLDGRTLALREQDIVIVAGSTPVALAGIMGGESTSITPTTTRVLLESATFHAASIRRTGRAHGLRTDASARFEKGLDPEITVAALKRAAYLLQQVAGGHICSTLHDSYPQRSRTERPRIHLSFARIQQVLGVHISAAETKSILHKLGFQLPMLTKSSFEAVPPSWRRDITLPEDIIEELVRLWGFERLPDSLPSGTITPPFPNTDYEISMQLRHRLAALGMWETRHQPFASLRMLEQLSIPLENAIKLPEPLSKENEYLIPSLAVPLLHNLAGINSRYTQLALFEIGNIFSPPRTEKTQLAMVWRSTANTETVYRQAKMVLGEIARLLAIAPIEFSPSNDTENTLSSTGVLQLQSGGVSIGKLGQVSLQTIQALKIRAGKSIVIAFIDFNTLLHLPQHNPVFSIPSSFPTIERDVTIVVAADMHMQEVTGVLLAHVQPLLISRDIKEIYRGIPLANEVKSVTLHLIYSSLERTLTDTEISSDLQRLTEALQTKLPAQIA